MLVWGVKVNTVLASSLFTNYRTIAACPVSLGLIRSLSSSLLASLMSSISAIAHGTPTQAWNAYNTHVGRPNAMHLKLARCLQTVWKSLSWVMNSILPTTVHSSSDWLKSQNKWHVGHRIISIHASGCCFGPNLVSEVISGRLNLKRFLGSGYGFELTLTNAQGPIISQ